MESIRRKRKGCGSIERGDLLRALSLNDNASLHLSLEQISRRAKKCREQTEEEDGTSCNSRVAGIVTVPHCRKDRISLSNPHGRGLKRKLGCIESATQMGRKKKLEQEYILGPQIGQGKFGSVRMCRNIVSGVEYACKSLPKKGEETAHREVEIMQHLSGHPSVVTLRAVYEDADSFHLVMELCSGGRLLDEMLTKGCYSEQRAAVLIKELVLVIKYCHEMGVVHRDIKPENILLTMSGKMKLADFGLAVRITTGQSLSGVAGSPAYVAPEVLFGSYSEKVDIWGAGVLLHALLVGSLPFQGKSVDDIFEAVKKVELNFHVGKWDSVSVPARDLLGKMLTRDVETRITADEVLKHPWILFYTERTLRPISVRSKTKNPERPMPRTPVLSPKELSERDRESSNSLDDSKPPCLDNFLNDDSEEEEGECIIVDALAAAISHIRISEPKRSRVCSPIEQECSSNMKATNLCTAF
ncbi:serine/threonine-protein kinase PEPKR2 [Amborella trichopoda]|uniref:Protein kinase domain-containing protein n=1 Tax=Amborella trichopoda TaxID=13333 RepID=W1P7H6_AMBTC|nr:serine/threonine-protein kinase PEPKR2 [Amborella trichopoda]ERN02925.1 hypothetical protein AMTR_s00135p00089260 [Amborella trichopoda]|eukprot:XP_006841250.1 serine/threonine-protein kinase PEPKR2 [Amborella trichopoda]